MATDIGIEVYEPGWFGRTNLIGTFQGNPSDATNYFLELPQVNELYRSKDWENENASEYTREIFTIFSSDPNQPAIYLMSYEENGIEYPVFSYKKPEFFPILFTVVKRQNPPKQAPETVSADAKPPPIVASTPSEQKPKELANGGKKKKKSRKHTQRRKRNGSSKVRRHKTRRVF
jgi:hypothetical protein